MSASHQNEIAAAIFHQKMFIKFVNLIRDSLNKDEEIFFTECSIQSYEKIPLAHREESNTKLYSNCIYYLVRLYLDKINITYLNGPMEDAYRYNEKAILLFDKVPVHLKEENHDAQLDYLKRNETELLPMRAKPLRDRRYAFHTSLIKFHTNLSDKQPHLAQLSLNEARSLSENFPLDVFDRERSASCQTAFGKLLITTSVLLQKQNHLGKAYDCLRQAREYLNLPKTIQVMSREFKDDKKDYNNDLKKDIKQEAHLDKTTEILANAFSNLSIGFSIELHKRFMDLCKLTKDEKCDPVVARAKVFDTCEFAATIPSECRFTTDSTIFMELDSKSSPYIKKLTCEADELYYAYAAPATKFLNLNKAVTLLTTIPIGLRTEKIASDIHVIKSRIQIEKRKLAQWHYGLCMDNFYVKKNLQQSMHHNVAGIIAMLSIPEERRILSDAKVIDLYRRNYQALMAHKSVAESEAKKAAIVADAKTAMGLLAASTSPTPPLTARLSKYLQVPFLHRYLEELRLRHQHLQLHLRPLMNPVKIIMNHKTQ